MSELFLIHVLAQKADVSIDRIRFYEKKGLIQPILQADNRYRYYNQHSVERLIFIKNCRKLHLSLAEIAQLLQLLHQPQQDCHQVNDLIDRHIAQVERDIAQLQQFHQQLLQLRQRCPLSQAIADCQILAQLQKSAL